MHICLNHRYGVSYGLNSFRDSYIAALFRHFDNEGVTYSGGIRDRVRTKIASMVKNGDIASEQIPREKGAEPILPFDIELLAQRYPRGCRDRTQVLAFMSVGLHTGLRGVSLESMLWKDTRVATPVESKPWPKQMTLLCHATSLCRLRAINIYRDSPSHSCKNNSSPQASQLSRHINCLCSMLQTCHHEILNASYKDDAWQQLPNQTSHSS